MLTFSVNPPALKFIKNGSRYIGNTGVGQKLSKTILSLIIRNKITFIIEIQFCMESTGTESITLWSGMNNAYRCRQSQKHSWDIPNKKRISSVSLVAFICCLALQFLFSMALGIELIQRPKKFSLEKKGMWDKGKASVPGPATSYLNTDYLTSLWSPPAATAGSWTYLLVSNLEIHSWKVICKALNKHGLIKFSYSFKWQSFVILIHSKYTTFLHPITLVAY